MDSGSAEYPQKVGEVWTRREGDQMAVYNPTTGTLTMLNSSALAIWELCDGRTSIDEIVDAIVEISAEPRVVVEHEVNAVVRLLREAQLVGET